MVFAIIIVYLIREQKRGHRMSTSKTVKPDYVANFDKPPHTEIKHIGGHWYLYGTSSKYDPATKKSKKKSTGYIGAITPSGLVSKQTVPAPVYIKPSDVVEMGLTYYFYVHSEETRQKLQQYFPDTWKELYTLAILKASGQKALSGMQEAYQDSILAYMYPSLALSGASLTKLLHDTGKGRNNIRKFMTDSLEDEDRFILFDGHRLLTASSTMELAEVGYDTKRRFKPQINLIYIFSLGEKIGAPLYYKQFAGNIVDINAFADILKESNCYGKDYTIIGDKGFGDEELFELMGENSMKYIIPLDRGNKYVKGKVPASPYDYSETFTYHKRCVHCVTFMEDGFKICLYLDMDFLSQESADLATNNENKNEKKEHIQAAENARRLRGKGKYTDAELEKFNPIPTNEVYADKKELGTITIKTNRTNLNSEQIYNIYKQRQAIEKFFNFYDNEMDGDATYMRNSISEEGYLFINHLCAMMCVDMVEDIAAHNKSKQLSYKKLSKTLGRVRVANYEGKFDALPVKKATDDLCTEFGVNRSDLATLGFTNNQLL